MSALPHVLDSMLRSAAFDLLSHRDGQGGWKRYRAEFRADTTRSPTEMQRNADERLRAILAHAMATTEHYASAWGALGFTRSRPPGPADLQSLPFLTKSLIRNGKTALRSDQYSDDQLTLSYTGGTTGTQTPFYLDKECFITRVGRQWGVLERCGYQPGIRRGLIWGVHSDLPPQGGRRSAKQWFRDYASGHEVLACTVMSEPQMVDYHARLVRFAPRVLYGYPSAIAQFGTFIAERGLTPIKVRSIMTTAELLTNTRRQRLQQLFGGEVFNLYCTREHGCIAFECTQHKGMHIDTGGVHLEITREGQRLPPGEIGEITLTDLRNYGMPFIRSRIGDLGALSTEPCHCGLPFPLLESLEGRSTDMIHRPDGSRVPGLMLTDLFCDMPSILFAQFVQEQPQQLDIFVVATEQFDSRLERAALQEVVEIVGPDMRVQFKRVPEITRSTRSGKLREVICTIGETAAGTQ